MRGFRHSKLGQRHALLPHIFARAVGVARLARLIALQEQELARTLIGRSEEHTSELQSLMRISYAVFCLKKKKINYEQRRCLKNLLHYKNNTTSNVRSKY